MFPESHFGGYVTGLMRVLDKKNINKNENSSLKRVKAGNKRPEGR